eukprot:TRINITY_DN5056_c0_g1::TRINITY_DN5056_c0_g1_i1::g.24863::m.24863 TRINITY_DN5056_c0_g1::TRINITY_DN5056_c0_g1_i1::g.24863  ORF type:complete len:450 (+),score=70.78,sp/O13861/TCD_SCHPO/43.72/8e-81,ThiF/PF00899.16/1.8e-38,Saccharop_dh/PF03435.13/0.00021,TrkA_N/PF02254.13/0.069,Ldh_1_N/PF00056.18/0.087,ApbA/PF02558.11/0.37,ApbA/PF02558.11/1.6e+03,3HCDH_N/PF02737.13/0.2,NAD_binding_7/PF13241.1/0.27,Birna_VP4/PF01768.11/1.4,Birna_VP4/PF01768.11/1.8e+02 TRINITY_DN5056_c0_g1_i1:26-1351(+)
MKAEIAFSLGAVAALAAVSAYNHVNSKQKRNAPKQPMTESRKPADESGAEAVPESIIREQLARNYKFFDDESMKRIRNAFVIVVGVGGVGSHCAHMLCRSGVGKIRIIDFDQVTLSSLNRHAVAKYSDVGLSKVDVMKRHFKEISPYVQVDAVNELFDIKKAEKLLGGRPDFVIDCIDNIETKVDLIKYCLDNKLPILSSMASGARADPSRIRVGYINDVEYDELARDVRQRLRRAGVSGEIPLRVVFSTERSRVKLLPLEGDVAENPHLYQTVEKFRVRILPVIGTIPASFGNALASVVLTEMAEKPITDPVSTPVVLSRNCFHRIHSDLNRREETLWGATKKLRKWEFTEFKFVYEEIWRGQSALSGRSFNLVMTRWDKTKPSAFSNLVLLTSKEADEHDKLEDVSQVDPEYRARVLRAFEDLSHWEYGRELRSTSGDS